MECKSPYPYRWHTNCSDCSVPLYSIVQTLRSHLAAHVLSGNTFHVVFLPLSENWLVVSQPVIAWYAIRISVNGIGRLIAWTGMNFGSFTVPADIQTSLDNWPRCPRAMTRTSVSLALITVRPNPEHSASFPWNKTLVSASSWVLCNAAIVCRLDAHTDSVGSSSIFDWWIKVHIKIHVYPCKARFESSQDVVEENICKISNCLCPSGFSRALIRTWPLISRQDIKSD